MKQFPRSPNGKYVYPICSVSGCKSFANQDYFKKTLDAKFGGSETRMIKEYVVREAKKYLEAGFTPEQIRKLATDNKGKLPKVNPKPKKDPRIPKKAKKATLKSFVVETVKVMEADKSGSFVEVAKPVYAWSNDPNYFKSEPAPLSIEDATKETCLYPGRFIDDKCHGCPVYEKCTLEQKWGPTDYLKKNLRHELKVTHLSSVDEELLKKEAPAV